MAFLCLIAIQATAAPAPSGACESPPGGTPTRALQPGDVSYAGSQPVAPGQPPLAAAPSENLAAAPPSGTQTVVNVLFVYSAEAQAAVTNTLDSLIDVAVSQVNGIFSNSVINVQLNAVYKGV